MGPPESPYKWKEMLLSKEILSNLSNYFLFMSIYIFQISVIIYLISLASKTAKATKHERKKIIGKNIRSGLKSFIGSYK